MNTGTAVQQVYLSGCDVATPAATSFVSVALQAIAAIISPSLLLPHQSDAVAAKVFDLHPHFGMRSVLHACTGIWRSFGLRGRQHPHPFFIITSAAVIPLSRIFSSRRENFTEAGSMGY